MTVYESCRRELPNVKTDLEAFEHHVQRAFDLHRKKREKTGELASREAYIVTLHPVDPEPQGRNRRTRAQGSLRRLGPPGMTLAPDSFARRATDGAATGDEN